MSEPGLYAQLLCVFCVKINNGGDEHGEVFNTTDPGIVRFEPLNPVTPGHMLFVPRRHDWHAYNLGAAVHRAALYGRSALAGWGQYDYNIIASHGAAASQTIEHPHVHYVPRQPNDGLLLPWTMHPSTRCEHGVCTLRVGHEGPHDGSGAEA